MNSLAAGQLRWARRRAQVGNEQALVPLTEPAFLTAERLASDLRMEIETLDQVGLTLGAELDARRLVEGVTQAGIAITGAAFGTFLYRDGSGDWTHFVSGAPPDAFVDFPISQDPQAFGSPFRGDVCRSDDLTDEAHLPHLRSRPLDL